MVDGRQERQPRVACAGRPDRRARDAAHLHHGRQRRPFGRPGRDGHSGGGRGFRSPPATNMAPGEKLAAARSLFDLVDLTTVQLWTIPGQRAQGPILVVPLVQAGTGATLSITMVQAVDNRWFVAMPDAAADGRISQGVVDANRGQNAPSGRLPAPSQPPRYPARFRDRFCRLERRRSPSRPRCSGLVRL